MINLEKLKTESNKALESATKESLTEFIKQKRLSNNSRYRLICEYAWGCVPIDIVWATNTNLYKETEERLIKQKILEK